MGRRSRMKRTVALLGLVGCVVVPNVVAGCGAAQGTSTAPAAAKAGRQNSRYVHPFAMGFDMCSDVSRPPQGVIRIVSGPPVLEFRGAIPRDVRAKIRTGCEAARDRS